jgi:RNA 2',3'-cyclic 3'-phosphodiesterase
VVATQDGLRQVPAASLHVTLAFLGERPDEEAEAIGRAVLACAAPVPGLSLAEPVWLPPGVLAVDLADGDGACAAVQTAVAAALADLGAFAPERRRFRPHVTVARVRRGARVDRRSLPSGPAGGPFAARALTLYRSALGAPGARYEPLARAVLGS